MPGFIIRWLICAASLWVAQEIVPGLQIADVQTILLAAALLGFVNAFVRPIAFFFTLPLTVLTLGLFLLVLNAAMLGLVAGLLKGVTIAGGMSGQGFITAVLASIVVSVTSWLANKFVGTGDGKKRD